MAGKPAKKILFIVQHRFNRSPGQRYRCEQYISYLEANGFECTYSPIIVSKEEDDALYLSTSKVEKASIFLKGILRRFKDARRAGNYDIIYIYREAFMTGSIFFEKLYKKSGAKIVFDFDDAIWLPTVSVVNQSLQWLKKPEKVNDITALSDLVIVGNTYLANHAKQFNKNVVVFPSTIDLNYYQLSAIGPRRFPADKITIGWSGSHTTVEHFETLVPVLKKLKAKYSNLHFVVYGDPHYQNEELGVESLPWTPESEVPVIGSFDIGVMPLPDNEWTRGKCAMKGLQYMGLGIPAVLAAVGMNNDVITDGENGFLATTEDEWFNKLSRLIEHEELRKALGKNGRITIEQKFSSQALQQKYLEIFQSV